MERTIRNTKLLIWALVLATVTIAGIASAQEDIGVRVVLLVASLFPAAPAILLGSWVNDMKERNRDEYLY
ncbi:hypothetical protein [Rothia mucilaginosa]|uniref:hypothetical protein n=1 Tax=Rothia mucilaginosa TaxID=43675 RepID=UPI00288A27B0|nr:hypothetical protein [Rothia mucilaginosa]